MQLDASNLNTVDTKYFFICYLVSVRVSLSIRVCRVGDFCFIKLCVRYSMMSLSLWRKKIPKMIKK